MLLSVAVKPVCLFHLVTFRKATKVKVVSFYWNESPILFSFSYNRSSSNRLHSPWHGVHPAGLQGRGRTRTLPTLNVLIMNVADCITSQLETRRRGAEGKQVRAMKRSLPPKRKGTKAGRQAGLGKSAEAERKEEGMGKQEQEKSCDRRNHGWTDGRTDGSLPLPVFMPPRQ